MKKTLFGLFALSFLAVQSLLPVANTFAANYAQVGEVKNLTILSGVYGNDTTPTFTWNAGDNASWYSIAIDGTDWKSVGNTFSFTTPELDLGWHSFYVRSHVTDRMSPNATTYIVFNIGTTVTETTISTVSPTSAELDEETRFSVTVSGNTNVDCAWYVNDVEIDDMTQNGSTFYTDFTFEYDGVYDSYVACIDEYGNAFKGNERTITVDEDVVSNNDDISVGKVSPSSATEDEEVTFSIDVEADNDIDYCHLYVDGKKVATMDETNSSQTEFEADYTFSNDGDYSVYAVCEDEDGNVDTGTKITVDVESEDDNNGVISVGKVSPTTAVEDESTTFSVEVDADYTVDYCDLYVDGDKVKRMSEYSNDEFKTSYKFSKNGSYTAYAYCEDSRGNTDKGTSVTVKVYDEDEYEGYMGELIKMECGSNPGVNDPCKAVYYYGEDGKRHTFPNEATFYSWYSDFDDVIEIDEDTMSDIALGDNVTLRPGSVLVKFLTSSKVYAIEAPNVLRHYETESLAKSDYGSDWADYVIELPDSLYGNYEIGKSIDSSSDFDHTDAYFSVDSLEDLF